LEFYTEILGFERNVNIAGFMTLLARKNPPGGHELCPCGSGQRLRTCHRDAVAKAREKVEWQAAKIDIELLRQPEIPKAVAAK
jgi:SEC-C motif